MGLRVRRGRLAAGSVAGLGFAALLVACGAVKDRGELIVAMQTDLSLPKDIDQVEISVTSYGKTLWDENYSVNPNTGGVKLPATLGVVGDPTNPSAPVEIQIIAKQTGGGTSQVGAHVLRSVTTTVPDGKTSLLRMPFEWLCWNQVSTDPTSGTATSTCPVGQTCVAGTCAVNSVDSEQLEPFDPSEVFGGSADAAGGECFDTFDCFSQGSEVPVNTSNCSIAAPTSAGTGINVGLVVSNSAGSTAGICNPQTGAGPCYVPLDQDPQEGWSQSGGTIMLPPAVCAHLASASPAPAPNQLVTGVTVTTTCPTKTAQIPTCGPWDSVGSNSANGIKDGGTNTGPGGCIVGTWTQTNGGNTCNGETANNTVDVTYDGSQYFVALTAGPFDNGSGGCETLNDQQVPAIASEDGTILTFNPSLSQVCSCASSAVSITLQVTGCGTTAGPTLTATENFSGVTQCPSNNGSAQDAGLGAPDGATKGSSSSGGGSSGGAPGEDASASNLSGECLAWYDCCVALPGGDATSCEQSITAAQTADGPNGASCTTGLQTCQTESSSSSGGTSSGGTSSSGSSSGGGNGTNFCATCGSVTCTVTETFAQQGSGTTVPPGDDASAPITCSDTTCGSNSMCCGTTCTDVQNDPSNCGNCGNDCSGGTCQNGQCQGGTHTGTDGGALECGPGNCAGCCQGAGGPCVVSATGTSGPCGANGAQCVGCPGGELCNAAGACVLSGAPDAG